VLIRSINTLAQQDDNTYNAATEATPVHLRAQLDHFHSDKNRFEEYTQHDRSIWIMDKLLQQTRDTIMGSMDPTTASLIQWQGKSVVDSLTGVFSGKGGK